MQRHYSCFSRACLNVRRLTQLPAASNGSPRQGRASASIGHPKVASSETALTRTKHSGSMLTPGTDLATVF